MELCLESNEAINTNKIYELLLPAINKIYANYKFLNMSDGQFRKIVNDQLLEAIQTYGENRDYTQHYYDELNKRMKKVVKSSLLSLNKAIEIINNYIILNVNAADSLPQAIFELNKLGTFFENYKYIPSIDLMIELLNKNQLLSNLVKVFVQSNVIERKLINTNHINKHIILLIEAYCVIKDIEVDDYDEENNESEIFESKYVQSDIVDMYIKEINRIPLLTSEEERKLFYCVKNGDLIAKNKLIESNLKLVVSLAKKYIKRGTTLLDLVQYGNMGLMRAIEKFDVERGCSFSTYAAWWIKRAVFRGVNEMEGAIRKPFYMKAKISLYKSQVYELQMDLGREPNIEEIAQVMNISVEEVYRLRKYQANVVSGNQKLDDDSNTEIIDFFPSDDISVENAVVDYDMKEKVLKLLDVCKLNDVEKKVIIMRYGLDGNECHTLGKIGEEINLSGERIRQIEKKTIEKIGSSKHIISFAEYMDNPKRAVKKLATYPRKKH